MALAQPLTAISDGALRWPLIFMSHGTLYIWDSIVKNSISESNRTLFLLIGLLNPLWGWGAFISTPDIPLVFFWSLSLLYVGRILSTDQWKDYLGLSVALGLGFLSKYHVALFLPCLLVMLWQQKQLNKILRPKAWVSILLALVVCSPVFIWNAMNEWVSFDFQWKHGMSFKYWKWTLPLEYVFGQLFIIFPTFLLFFFSKSKKWTYHWLLPFATFPFAFFLYSSFKGRVEANWVIMSIPCIYAISLLYSSKNQWKWASRTLYLWGFLFFVALSLIPLKNYLPDNKIKLFESDRYQELIPLAKNNQNVYAYSYQLASFLSFKTDKLVCKLPGYGRPDHFQFFAGCQDYLKGFIYLTEHNDRRDFSKDFPGLKKQSEKRVGTQFKIVKVVPE